MLSDRQTSDLIALMMNRRAPLENRDDAAMDLRESDAPEAMRMLLKIATEQREDELLQASAGESLAVIWLRNGIFPKDILEQLTTSARAEVVGLLARDRPEWLQ